MKLYAYDIDGNLQEKPDGETKIISEKPLTIENSDYIDFPSNVGLSRPLVPGEIVNLVLDPEFDLKGALVLDYNENPLPTDFDTELAEHETTLAEILQSEYGVGVIKFEDGKIWFDPDFAAYAENMKTKEKSETSGIGGFIFFLILILALLSIIISKCS